MTLTMEPKDWINTGLEDEAAGVTAPDSGAQREDGGQTRPLRGFDVELRRKPGEGFGFVIASQDVENGKGESQKLISCDAMSSNALNPTNRLRIIKLHFFFPPSMNLE